MAYRLAAGAVLLLHLAFIAFVVFGALIAVRRRWLLAVHLPVVVWGFLVEFKGLACPLTYAEQFLLVRAGEAGYEGGFIEHYLLPLVYPAGLTRQAQWVLAFAVIAVNAVLYGWLLALARAQRRGLTEGNCGPPALPKCTPGAAASRPAQPD